LVIGKGVSQKDVVNSGFVPLTQLKDFLKQGADQGFAAGFMGWQFSSDGNGTWSEELASVFH
jgi:hypothetical protein